MLLGGNTSLSLKVSTKDSLKDGAPYTAVPDAFQKQDFLKPLNSDDIEGIEKYLEEVNKRRKEEGLLRLQSKIPQLTEESLLNSPWSLLPKETRTKPPDEH